MGFLDRLAVTAQGQHLLSCRGSFPLSPEDSSVVAVIELRCAGRVGVMTPATTPGDDIKHRAIFVGMVVSSAAPSPTLM